MNLSQFNSLVSQTLRRGTTLDPSIPLQTQLAAQWLERNYTFKYMERFKLVQINQEERTIDLPPEEIKAFKFFRIVNSDGTYQYLRKIEPEDLGKTDSPLNVITGQSIPATQSPSQQFVPRGYFVVGNSTLVLNAIPQANFNGEAMYYAYTDWPADGSTIPGANPASTFAHPLLASAADVLLAQTQMYCSVNLLKDMRMMAAYKELRDEGVNTMTRAEDETKWGGEDMKMIYNPQYDQRILTNVTGNDGSLT